MNHTPVRIGIIGCGGVARSHARGYSEHRASVTALMDADKAAVESMAENFEGAKCFSDCTKLLDSGLVEAVSICTPHAAHEDAAVAALKRNVHVLLEKPMAHSVESGKRITKAAEESKPLLIMGFRHRLVSGVRKIREIIDAETIGPVVLFHNVFNGSNFEVKTTWRSNKSVAGGGVLIDNASHSVDLFRYLIGEVVEQKTVMHRYFEGTDVEDTGIIVLKAGDGAIGSIASSRVAGDSQSIIDITGQKGRIVFDYGRSDEVRMKLLDSDEWETMSVQPVDSYVAEIECFLKAIRGEASPLSTAQDGLRALEIIHAGYGTKEI